MALFSRRARALPAVELHPARWNRCGRDKNQYVVLSDGTALCARYRDPHNKLIHGTTHKGDWDTNGGGGRTNKQGGGASGVQKGGWIKAERWDSTGARRTNSRYERGFIS